MGSTVLRLMLLHNKPQKLNIMARPHNSTVHSQSARAPGSQGDVVDFCQARAEPDCNLSPISTNLFWNSDFISLCHCDYQISTYIYT